MGKLDTRVQSSGELNDPLLDEPPQSVKDAMLEEEFTEKQSELDSEHAAPAAAGATRTTSNLPASRIAMMQQAISLDPSRFTDMQIILVRHGRPDHGAARWSTPIGMKAWVARYNAAAVATGERPDSLVELAGSVGIVVCSSLQRCVESRSQLACDCCRGARPAVCRGPSALSGLGPAIAALAVLATGIPWRLVSWLLQPHRACRRINRTSRAAADRLIALAEEHGSVLLMGHKIMNALIARELRRRGWKGPMFPLLSGYWQPSRYTGHSSEKSAGRWPFAVARRREPLWLAR